MMKGQSPLISHALTISFSIILLMVVVTSMNSINDNYKKFFGNNEVKEVCSLIKSGVDTIYFPTNYFSNTNSSMGEIKIDLPDRIADLRYRARFNSTDIFVELLDMDVNQTCVSGYNATFKGSSPGGRTKIEWIRYGNETDEIIMERILE